MNTNLGALFGLRSSRQAARNHEKTLERLATGLRINRGSDAPSDLVLVEQLRRWNHGLRQGIDNLQNGANVINTADHAIGQISNLLTRLQAIIVEASQSSVLSTEQMNALQDEVEAILGAIDRVSRTTRYSDKELLNGSLRKDAAVTFSLGPPNVGGVKVPEHSNILSGIHRLEMRKQSIIVGVNGTGVVGEFGRISGFGGNSQPVFSPDGTRVAYISPAQRIYSHHSRGTNLPPAAPTPIIVANARPGLNGIQYTSSGTQMIWEDTSSGQQQIYIGNANGSGGISQIGFLGPNYDPAVTRTGIDRVAFVGPIDGSGVSSYAAPGPNTTGLTLGLPGELLALSNATNTVWRINAATGAPLAPIALPGGNYTAIAFDGANMYVAESFAGPAPDLVHVFDLTGAPVAPAFAVGASVSSATVPLPNPNTADPGVLAETAFNLVSSSQLTTAERITVTFTSTPTPATNAGYSVTGSTSGFITNGTFTSGAPITVNGVQFTLTGSPTAGTSVSGLPTVANVTRSHMFVSVNGGAPVEVQFNAPLAGGANIAAAIDAAVAGMTASFDGTNYTLTSQFQGANSTVVVTGGTTSGYSRSAAGATYIADDGVSDQLTVSVDGGPAVTYDIAAAGDLASGAAIAAAITATVPGLTASFDGANYTLTSSTTGSASSVIVSGPAGSAGDLLNLRDGVEITRVDGYDDAAAQLNLGAANGGTESSGTGVRAGDTYQYDVLTVGDEITGMTFDGANLRIADGTLNRAFRWSTAGVQDTAYNVRIAPSFTMGPVTSMAWSGANSYFVSDSSGHIVEVDATTGAVLDVHQNPATNPANQGIAYDGANVYVSNPGDNLIYTINPAAGAGNSVYVQNLVGGLITQISQEAGNEADPSLSGNGARIAYETQGGGIVVRNIDGSNPVTIIGAGASNPVLSWNGQYVAYNFGGNIRIARTSDGAVTDTFAGANASFSPNGVTFLYENGGNIEVANLNAAGVRTGVVTSFAGNSGHFTMANNGNRIVYQNAIGQIYVRFADGTPLDPYRQNNGTVITVDQLFSTLPFIQLPETIVTEDITLTLVTDVDGYDTWSVVGARSGVHAAYVVGSGVYTTDTTAFGGGGVSFELNPDGQFAVGDQIVISVEAAARVSLDGGPWQLARENRSSRVVSGEKGTLDFHWGRYFLWPSAQALIRVDHSAHLQGGIPIEDRVGYSIENMNPAFLDLAGMDVRRPEGLEVSTGIINSYTLWALQQPSPLAVHQVERKENIIVDFTSPTTYDVWGSKTGKKQENRTYTPGEIINVDGVEFVLTGAASTGDSFEYSITQVPQQSRVAQAIRFVNSARAELGSIDQELEHLVDVKGATHEAITNAISDLRDANIAKEVSNMVREHVLRGSALNAVSQSLLTGQQLLSLLTQ